MWRPVFTCTILPNYSSDALAPLWVRAPGSCLARTPVSPDLVTVLPNYSWIPILYCNSIHSQPRDRFYKQA